MKLILIGLPGSGRSTVAEALGQSADAVHIDSRFWMKGSFRGQRPDEHPDRYYDAYHECFTSRMRSDPSVCINYVHKAILAYQSIHSFSEPLLYLIDGLSGPKDFVELFDYTEDMVVFLNRIDNDTPHKDYESIGVSVIRDYCFWLSSADLLPRERWLEYNFRMADTPSDQIKTLGSKNSVFVVKSLNKVIEHLREVMPSRQVDEGSGSNGL